MFKVIRLSNGRYYHGVLEGEVITVVSPLDAKKFVPKERWYNEVELNKASDELEERYIEYTVYMLDYSVNPLY